MPTKKNSSIFPSKNQQGESIILGFTLQSLVPTKLSQWILHAFHSPILNTHTHTHNGHSTLFTNLSFNKTIKKTKQNNCQSTPNNIVNVHKGSIYTHFVSFSDILSLPIDRVMEREKGNNSTVGHYRGVCRHHRDLFVVARRPKLS